MILYFYCLLIDYILSHFVNQIVFWYSNLSTPLFHFILISLEISIYLFIYGLSELDIIDYICNVGILKAIFPFRLFQNSVQLLLYTLATYVLSLPLL